MTIGARKGQAFASAPRPKAERFALLGPGKINAVGPPLEFPVDISTTLAADLEHLLRVLDLPDVDVAQAVDDLRDKVERVVPSFVGLSLTLLVSGQPVTLSSVTQDRPTAASSLRLPLHLTSAATPGSELVLFASTPGAFVDLAADLGYVLQADEGVIQLDRGSATPNRSGLFGLPELAMVNRALGVLIGRGMTPEEAEIRMESEALLRGVEVFRVAASVLSDTE